MKLFNDFLGVIFPDYCPGCGRTLNNSEHALCLHCKNSLPLTHFTKVKDNEVEKLLWGRVKFYAATAYLQFRAGGLTQKILHEVKYKGNADLAQEMGCLLAREVMDSERFSSVDCILPVPLHPRKLERRGYNQSELLGRGLSDIMGVPMHTEFLRRKVDSKTQTRKSRWDRWKNTSEVFEFTQEQQPFQHLLLLDDVITTGATIEACTDAIQRKFSGRVSVVTLAFPMN